MAPIRTCRPWQNKREEYSPPITWRQAGFYLYCELNELFGSW